MSTNSVPQAALGDLIVYDWTNDGTLDHMAIVTGFRSGDYPLASEMGQFDWTTHPWYYADHPTSSYIQRGWTWSQQNNEYLEKTYAEPPGLPPSLQLAHDAWADTWTIDGSGTRPGPNPSYDSNARYDTNARTNASASARSRPEPEHDAHTSAVAGPRSVTGTRSNSHTGAGSNSLPADTCPLTDAHRCRRHLRRLPHLYRQTYPEAVGDGPIETTWASPNGPSGPTGERIPAQPHCPGGMSGTGNT